MKLSTVWKWVGGFLVILASCQAASAQSQLNEYCVVSVLNRTVLVKPDGTWVLPNIPANFGPVRARATCVEGGVTRSGESTPFVIPSNGSVDIPRIVLGPVTPIPSSVVVGAPVTTLRQPGQRVQLAVLAGYPDGSSRDITADSGTQYLISNPALASLSAGGQVTALRSGTVLVQAVNEGAQGLLQLSIALTTDSDGDGILDDVEVAAGLDPNNPVDGREDPDRDGLSNREELAIGTSIRVADTDGDGISDGEEVVAGADGYITNPLLADTDGDGVRDLTEIQTGSDPTNRNSVNLAGALTGIQVSPGGFTLVVNSLTGIASVQLTVQGRLRDGTTIDLTDSRWGTTYDSTNVNVCNFGGQAGLVFAGQAGTCSINVANGTFRTVVSGTVQDFAPSAVSFVSIPGYANDVAVSGNFAFVAAGSRGLQVVGLDAARRSPSIVGALALNGNANGIAIAGNRAYVAAGSSGLHVIDISAPATPRLLGSTSTGGTAYAVRVDGTVAFVANGGDLRIVNVANPAAMISVASVPLGGTSQGIDIDLARGLAVVAAGGGGVHLLDVSTLTSPVRRSTVASSNAQRVALRGNVLFVADYEQSLRAFDVTDVLAPRFLSSTTLDLGGRLTGLTLSGSFVLGSDVLFVNGVPVTDASDPTRLRSRMTINFPARDDNGMAVAADASYLYLVADRSGLSRFGSSGNSRLYIGQFQPQVDLAGVPPSVRIVTPAQGAQVYEGQALTVSAVATDDISVASVTFNIDGRPAFTATSGPYQYTMTVPTGVSVLALTTSATDLGGNVGNSTEVRLNVLPDPLTTVTGIVRDLSGLPVSGATVSTIGGRVGTSGTDGVFRIMNVPTVVGDIVVTVSATDGNGLPQTGASASVTPLRGGETSVGSVTVVSARFERQYGTLWTYCDDCASDFPITFSFPFYGASFSTAFVSTNGYLTFGGGDETYTETVPAFARLPRVSAFFDDLIGGGGVWVNNQIRDQFIVTYDRVQHYRQGGSITLQIQLYRDGRIIFAFDGVSALTTGAITGVTPGPNAPLQQVDFSVNRAFDIPGGTSVFEYFTDANPFDLDGAFVIFTPNPGGGYNVRTLLRPAPVAASVVSGGAALSGAAGARMSAQAAPPAPSAPARTSAAAPMSEALPPALDLRGAEVMIRSSAQPGRVWMANADEAGNFAISGIPAGGVEVYVRRRGEVVAVGSGAFSGGNLTQRRLLSLIVNSPRQGIKMRPVNK